MTVTGRLGQACAEAAPHAVTSAHTAKATMRMLVMIPNLVRCAAVRLWPFPE